MKAFSIGVLLAALVVTQTSTLAGAQVNAGTQAPETSLPFN